MTTYTDKLIEAMARDNPTFFGCVLEECCEVECQCKRDNRLALIAQLKFMIEHGPSEGQVKEALAEADRHGYYATMEYFGLDEAIYTFTAMCRALLAELEGP